LSSPVAVLVDRGLTRAERVIIALTGAPTDAAALVLARHLGPSRPKPVRFEELGNELPEADLVLVGAGPLTTSLEAMLESSRASVLWVHPAQSRSLAADAAELAPSHTVA
jgi:hypothetical protein